MKRFLSFILGLTTICFACADNYKILQMNTSTIKIGERKCKKGDTFSDNSIIYWSNSKQAIKAMNIKTKEIRLFTQLELQSKNSKTIADFLIKNNRASSRKGVVTVKEKLSDIFYLSDTIISPCMVNKTKNHYIRYQYKGDIIRKDLSVINGYFIIDKTMFPKDSDCDEFKISVFRTETGKEEDYCYTNEMIVVMIPEWIDE